jgi:phage gp36-like protein
MAYSKLEDIKKQLSDSDLIGLTDDNNTGKIDEAIVNEMIADADALIDSYCGAYYTVPFDQAPKIINKFSADIAIYNLYGRRQGAPEDRSDRHKNAIKALEQIAKGVIRLNSPKPKEDQHDKVMFSAKDPVFTKDRLENF